MWETFIKGIPGAIGTNGLSSSFHSTYGSNGINHSTNNPEILYISYVLSGLFV